MFTFRGEGERARGEAECAMRAEAENSKHRTSFQMILPPCCTRYFIQQKHVFLSFCKVCHLGPVGVNREWGMLK